MSEIKPIEEYRVIDFDEAVRLLQQGAVFEYVDVRYGYLMRGEDLRIDMQTKRKLQGKDLIRTIDGVATVWSPEQAQRLRDERKALGERRKKNRLKFWAERFKSVDDVEAEVERLLCNAYQLGSLESSPSETEIALGMPAEEEGE